MTASLHCGLSILFMSLISVITGFTEPADTKIAFVSNRDGNKEIYLIDVQGKNPVRLTKHQANDLQPSWSPDGRKLAFASSRDGNREIYVMDADGTHPIRLTNNDWHDDLPAWSPDGMKIAFRSYRGKNEIHLIDITDLSQKHPTAYVADGWIPSWSPDGNHLVYASNRDIHIISIDGKEKMNLTNNHFENRWPAWAPFYGQRANRSMLKTKLFIQWAVLKNH